MTRIYAYGSILFRQSLYTVEIVNFSYKRVLRNTQSYEIVLIATDGYIIRKIHYINFMRLL
jgi:hypothetical protein